VGATASGREGRGDQYQESEKQSADAHSGFLVGSESVASGATIV
jgi:hypothetical protein